MQAHAGDWLTVQSGRDSQHARRAAILATAAGGGPPYSVRWLDTGKEGLLFPGPDAQVVPAKEQKRRDRLAAKRAERVQREITRQAHRS